MLIGVRRDIVSEGPAAAWFAYLAGAAHDIYACARLILWDFTRAGWDYFLPFVYLFLLVYFVNYSSEFFLTA